MVWVHDRGDRDRADRIWARAVFVKDGATGTYPAPSTPVTLDQKACMYIPHVLGVMPGQPVEILNSDATLHNIHPLPLTNVGFNIGMPVQGMKQTRMFAKAEAPFHVKCVELKNLPAGTYQVAAWQEKYGTQTQSVTVAAGESKPLTFTFKGL